MAIVRWEPLRELTTLQNEMNRLFGSVFDTPPQGNGGTLRRWMPAMDLVETADHFVLRADLPGLAEEDVSVEVEDRVLTVSGERKVEHEATNEGYHRIERAFGSFSRSLTLPEGVDPEAVGHALAAMPGVVEVHDLHVWEVTSGFPALAAHVLVAPGDDCHGVRRALQAMVGARFGIEHVTLQVDHAPAGDRLLEIEPRR